MKYITIVLPYNDAENKTDIWALSEKTIDFRRDSKEAARCTMAFAATELKAFLHRTIKEAFVKFSARIPEGSFYIELKILKARITEESYRIEPESSGIVITGYGRTGVLYGVYHFLHMQGWRWYAPGSNGEIAPPVRENLVLPDRAQEFSPAMSLGRGFDFEGVLKESEELWMWMARNRLNLASYRSATAPLLHKLGMVMKVGGHIFESILAPDRMLHSGRTLWEEHENWYGLPADAVRKKEEALKTQFCVSQNDLLDFLGEELLCYIMGEWKEADRIDVWNFDTWGSTCHCDQCKSMGNSTDQNLYFLSRLRSFLDQAGKEGRLDHEVRLVLCSYEGTSTLQPPDKTVPQNIIDAGDYVVFYPILRCYAHDFNHADCSYNAAYQQALTGWVNHTGGLPVMVGEYYNVTKFEDLPLLFTERICNDIPFYVSKGVKGMTYMHLPMVNWGMRTLTQLLYAQLAWNPQTDTQQLINEYFTNWYGKYADDMRRVYKLTEEAWLYSANWRAWGEKSILHHFLQWDGTMPLAPLEEDDHFKAAKGVERCGRESIKKLREAMEILNTVRNLERMDTAKNMIVHTEAAVNPIEAQKRQQLASYELRLGEDRRLMIYGIDTMSLMTEMAAYYNALYHHEESRTEKAWNRIEALAEKMDSYYMPLTFEHPKVGLMSKDALTRTQLREVIRRCRKFRFGHD